MKTSNITMFLSITAFLLFTSYIFFASTFSSLGYELDKKERELSRLRDIQNDLVVELANYRSPERLLSQGESLGLIEIDTISRYIDTRVSSLSRVNP